MDVVSYYELEYPGDGLYYLNSIPFTGRAAYRNNGWSESEDDYVDGLLSGWTREWYGPSKIKLEAECEFGGYHGKCKEWHENGVVSCDARYEFGIRVEGTYWDSSGRQTERYRIPEGTPEHDLLEGFRSAMEP